MPKISAFIHTQNHARLLARTLDTLRPCDEILVIDHGSTDDTCAVARKHGASVKSAISGVEDGTYALDTRNDWVLCLHPGESLSEALEASLLDWKQRKEDDATGYLLPLREQKQGEWRRLEPEFRLVNRSLINWTAAFPPHQPATLLEGDLLCFADEGV